MSIIRVHFWSRCHFLHGVGSVKEDRPERYPYSGSRAIGIGVDAVEDSSEIQYILKRSLSSGKASEFMQYS